MSLIPDEELSRQGSINLAPMVDFLFLVIAIFAAFALTRSALYDSELQLVQASPSLQEKPLPSPVSTLHTINLSVTQEGQYKWIGESSEYLLSSVAAVKQELSKQQASGALPQDLERTKVLLHIDKDAKWEPIAQLIFGVKELGFPISPVYSHNPSTEKN